MSKLFPILSSAFYMSKNTMQVTFSVQQLTYFTCFSKDDSFHDFVGVAYGSDKSSLWFRHSSISLGSVGFWECYSIACLGSYRCIPLWVPLASGWLFCPILLIVNCFSMVLAIPLHCSQCRPVIVLFSSFQCYFSFSPYASVSSRWCTILARSFVLVFVSL